MFALAVFGPRERSTRSAKILNVSSRSGSMDRSFSKRIFIADNHGAPVILQSSRKNFAGGRALAAGQDHQRSGISDAGVGVGRYPDTSIIIFCLNDRARFQEQTGE